MATADRTTIKAATAALISALRLALVADPPTAAKPLRKVAAGIATTTEYPRPFLVVSLVRVRPIGVTENDKLLQVTTTLRLVTDITATDPHDALLDVIGALDDYLDSIIDTGVIEGADGFDDRTWVFEYPASSAGARTGVAQATQTFVVRVEREQNRVPAA